MFTADNLPEAARAKLDDFNAWLKQPAAGWIANFNAITAIILNRLDAALGGRLSALLNGTAAIETASPTPLPEWAKVTPDDLLLMAGKTWSNESDPLNYHAARVLARMPGAKPAEPVKPWADLTDEALLDAHDKAVEASCGDLAPGQYKFDPVDYAARRSRAAASLRASLSAYAPPPRKIEVTPEVMKAFVNAWSPAIGGISSEPGFEDCLADQLEGVRAAFDFANPQAEARESAEIARLRGEVERAGCAVAMKDHEIELLKESRDFWESKAGGKEIERLKGEVERLQAESRDADIAFKKMNAQIERLTKERDEVQRIAGERLDKYTKAAYNGAALRAHADQLEALLTVPGVDGPVKLWLPFEVFWRLKWNEARIAVKDIPILSMEAAVVGPSSVFEIRQSPAPAAEPLKRWRYPLSATSTVYVTTDAPCSINDLPEAVRDLAVEVIGEAE